VTPDKADAAPLRVLSIVPSMARRTGGPAKVLVDSTLAMAGRVDRTIFCTDAGAPAAAAHRPLDPAEMPAGAEHLDIQIFPTRRPRTLGYSPDLARCLRDRVGEFDLVTIHSLNLHPQLVAYRAARRAGVPYIVVPHGALDPWLRGRKRWRKRAADLLFQRRMLTDAAAVQFTTREEQLRSGWLLPRARVVPNGVNVAVDRASPEAVACLRRAWRLDEGELVILFLGRITAKKGVDVLIRAVAQAGGTAGARTQLVIVGPDDEGLTPKLIALSASLGIGERVRFAGPLYDDDKAAALAVADIWVLPSHTENFGNAVLEAMVAGAPVIISSEVNLARDVAEAAAGIVIAPTADALAGALTRVLSDAPLRARLCGAGARFAGRYSWTTVAGEVADFYQHAAGPR
jgi:glycosyltransferase involved in cell wall biosynthesis